VDSPAPHAIPSPSLYLRCILARVYCSWCPLSSQLGAVLSLAAVFRYTEDSVPRRRASLTTQTQHTRVEHDDSQTLGINNLPKCPSATLVHGGGSARTRASRCPPLSACTSRGSSARTGTVSCPVQADIGRGAVEVRARNARRRRRGLDFDGLEGTNDARGMAESAARVLGRCSNLGC
jgi:hypothetical protein